MFYTTRPRRPRQIDRDIQSDSNALKKKDQSSFTFQKATPSNYNQSEIELGDQDLRYFYQNDSPDILNLESAVTETPYDIQLWLKLASKKLNNTNSTPEDCMDQALNVLSRGIEENKHSSDLWFQYLVLFSKHGDSSDLTDFCQMAVECAPSFQIWWLYLHSVATYPDRNEICSEIIDYLCTRQNKSDLDPDLSHHLLEVTLYKVNLSLMVGRLQYATNILQGYFVKSEGKVSVQSYLTSQDKCILWLSYIHLNVTGELPCQLYDPATQMSGKIVSKENLILPWKKWSAPESLLDQQMALLQEAVNVCITSQLGTSPGCLKEGLVLYQNIILLLQSQNKLEEMLHVCRDLLQQDPTLVDVWMIVANLYAANNEVKATQQVFSDAKEVNLYSSKVFHYCAQFELLQKETNKAIECLEKCSLGYFHVDSNLCDPRLGDPALLYRAVLKQSLPLGYTPPTLKQDVTDEILKQEEYYIWLNFCLYLELQGDLSQAIEMYETALSSLVKAEHICMVWFGYLEFQYRQLKSSPEKESETKKFSELVHRCLLTMPSKFEVNHWPNVYWNNFVYVNRIIDWYLKVLLPEQKSLALDRLVTRMPTNIPLVFRACEEYLKLNEDQRALSICYPLAYEDTQNLRLWKLITSLALKQGSHKEIQRMFHRAAQILPYSTNLWRDFLMFKMTQGRGSREVIIAVISHCQQLGLPVDKLTENMPEIKLAS